MTKEENLLRYYRSIHATGDIPKNHIQYLEKLANDGLRPKIIYDIGAAVLHWTKNAKRIWPEARIIAFDAVEELKPFFDESGVESYTHVLSDIDGKKVTFYQHDELLGGNSYYKENERYSPIAKTIYSDSSKREKLTRTIDSLRREHNLPSPDFVKIDVQGAEVDILMGMKDTLQSVKNLVVELQHVEYNIGAKNIKESVPIIESLGFTLLPYSRGEHYFCGNGPDADYHFIKKVD